MKGADAAQSVLTKLMGRTENAHARSADMNVTMPVTKASMSAYVSLRSTREIDEFHGVVKEAERRGAIVLAWDERAGMGNALSRISVIDAKLLAEFLGVTPYWELESVAKATLRPILGQNPQVHQFLDAWRNLKKCRGCGPEHVMKVVHSQQVITYQIERQYAEITARELSARLFDDSKYLVTLCGVIDELVGDEMGDADDVLARLGVVQYSQPFLIAGPISTHWQDAPLITEPYIGLPPETFERCVKPLPVRAILSVENLTTFHILARDPRRPKDVQILYTAGIPTPVFLSCYRHLVKCAGRDVHVAHWGDIDLGGLRVAYRLWHSLQRTESRFLHPVLMDRRAHAQTTTQRKQLSAGEVAEIIKIAGVLGWNGTQSAVSSDPRAIEQEALVMDWAYLDA